MIVAIDGPAGSGKSTIAREVARRYGFTKLDTGAMYRSVAATALERGIDLDDEGSVVGLAGSIDITFGAEQGGNVSVFVDGRDVSRQIRTPEVDRNVSSVASYPGVRAAMLVPQRRFAEGRDVVAEGRDIGTVVFPEAELKIFLTADPHERARRRVIQRHEGEQVADGPCAPARCRLLDERGARAVCPYGIPSGTTAVEVVIHEGRKNQVKRMLSRIGHPVLRLHRARFGALRLSGVEEGAWRELTAGEVSALKASPAASPRRLEETRERNAR